MLQPTVLTWILILFGAITMVPLLAVQLIMIINPSGKKTKELIIGKNDDWRDKTHFKSAYALAWADWLFVIPLNLLGITGIILEQTWGYIFYAITGGIMVYINIFFWIFEKEFVYPSTGALAYYTYFWGNFVYWGLAALVYSVLRLCGVFF